MTIDRNQQANTSTHRSRRQWIAIAERRLKQGEYSDFLLMEIVADGYLTDEAQSMLDESLQTLNKRARGILGWSAALLIAGLVVSLSAFGSSDGVIWWGAILCGSIGVIYGLRTFVRFK
jgi:hypothetical protein